MFSRWLQRGPCRTLGFSVCAALSFPVLCSVNSSCLGLPGPSSLSLQLGRLLAFIWVPVSFSSVWKLSQGRGPPYLCPVSRGSPCFVAQCLKSVVLNILSVILMVSFWKINLVPVTPSGLEVEVTYLGFTQCFLNIVRCTLCVCVCVVYFLNGILP